MGKASSAARHRYRSGRHGQAPRIAQREMDMSRLSLLEMELAKGRRTGMVRLKVEAVPDTMHMGLRPGPHPWRTCGERGSPRTTAAAPPYPVCGCIKSLLFWFVDQGRPRASSRLHAVGANGRGRWIRARTSRCPPRIASGTPLDGKSRHPVHGGSSHQRASRGARGAGAMKLKRQRASKRTTPVDRGTPQRWTRMCGSPLSGSQDV